MNQCANMKRSAHVSVCVFLPYGNGIRIRRKKYNVPATIVVAVAVAVAVAAYLGRCAGAGSATCVRNERECGRAQSGSVPCLPVAGVVVRHTALTKWLWGG